MVIYLDNDTIINLAELNILDLLCDALGIDHHETCVFVLRSCPDFVRNQVAEPARGRVLVFLSKCGYASMTYHGTEFAELSGKPGMNNEAELYACCCNDTGAIMSTGDHRSARSIIQFASAGTRAKLANRLLAPEQCIMKIIDHFGFAEVHSRWAGQLIDHNFLSTLDGMSEQEVKQSIEERMVTKRQSATDLYLP